MAEEPDRPDMVRQLLRERERLAHQARHPLAERTIEALDVVRLTFLLPDGSVTR